MCKVKFPEGIVLLVLGIACFFVFMLFDILRRDGIDEDIQKNKVCSVGKVFDIEVEGKGYSVKYSIIHERLMYEIEERVSSDDVSDSDDCLNKYYKVAFSSKHPKHSTIFIDQEVIDLDEIRKAGF